ncbi:MAG: sulfatase [Gemmatales bacterium]
MRGLSTIILLFMLAQLAMATEKPNFVIMMCDDQRFDAMSCAGNTIIKTPNMDRLAAEGMYFKNMFVTNSLCAPSRATLLTGLYSHANGVTDNFGKNVPANIKMLPEYLHEAGYEVGFCGKSHIRGALRDRPWDYYFGYRDQGRYVDPIIAEGVDGVDKVYPGYMDDIVTEKAIAWMKKPRTKPFCLFLFFKAPHRQWVPATRHKDLYADKAIPKPSLWDHPGTGKPSAFLMAANMFGQYPDTKDYEGMVRDYYRTITAADDNIGKVYAALSEMKKLDQTVLMHTSDNGFFLGEWQRFDKRFMHEPSIRVPLLVRYPALVNPGSVSEKMVINADLAPTILDLAGLPAVKGLHGRSFKTLLAGETNDWRKDWYYEYHEYPDPSHNVQKMRGVRTDRYKLIHYYEPPPRFTEAYELYDLRNDPEKKVNLQGRADMKAVKEQLLVRIKELRTELGANQP